MIATANQLTQSSPGRFRYLAIPESRALTPIATAGQPCSRGTPGTPGIIATPPSTTITVPVRTNNQKSVSTRFLVCPTPAAQSRRLMFTERIPPKWPAATA